MDYTRKTDSTDTNQDSELIKINQQSIKRSLNNKIFVKNSLLSEPVKINVINDNDVILNLHFDNTLFYNHSDDHNKINSSIRTQCLIFIPLVSIKIFIPFFYYNSYLIYAEHAEGDEQEIKHEKYFSYTLLLLIYLCYFLSMKTSSKQMIIEKYIYKRINNSKNINQNNENNSKEKNDIKSINKNEKQKEIENLFNNQVTNFNNKDENLAEKITYFDLKNYNQICNYCHIRTFIRATHCLICDECILLKEEHCPYIANCIGFNNIQYFINLLFWCIYGLINYIIICIKCFIKFNVNISIFPLIFLISDFAINLMILKALFQKLYKLLYNIYNNLTQYEIQIEETSNNEKKSHNLFNIGFLSNLYYIIGPTPFHFLFPLPKIKNYENDENCPIFLKCKFPTRLELIKYMAKRDPKYKEILNDVESDPYNYLKLCHNFYDNKNIE